MNYVIFTMEIFFNTKEYLSISAINTNIFIYQFIYLYDLHEYLILILFILYLIIFKFIYMIGTATVFIIFVKHLSAGTFYN